MECTLAARWRTTKGSRLTDPRKILKMHHWVCGFHPTGCNSPEKSKWNGSLRCNWARQGRQAIVGILTENTFRCCSGLISNNNNNPHCAGRCSWCAADLWLSNEKKRIVKQPEVFRRLVSVSPSRDWQVQTSSLFAELEEPVQEKQQSSHSPPPWTHTDTVWQQRDTEL